MNRLLIIHCPVNPRTLNQQTRAGDLDTIGPAENFRWCLYDSAQSVDEAKLQGHGALSDLPFADEALVLMPSVDVRLIRARVPMIGDKKLAALLPTLTEPYLLDQRTPLLYQALPPVAGTKAMERTIAVMSETWLNWLVDQLAVLPVRVVTLIPDCLLLEEPNEQQPSEIMLTQHGALYAVACREGRDWGAGWIEADSNAASTLAALYPESTIRSTDWNWLAPRAGAWFDQKQSVNLLQKLPAKKKTAKGTDKPTARWSAKVDWMHWRRPFHIAGIAFAIYIGGSAFNLGLLTLSNWRWQVSIAETARQYLGSSGQDGTAAIRTLIAKTTRSIHAQGGTIPSDFVPMAAKLQVLLGEYPAGLLERLDYQPDGLTFTLRKGISTPDTASLLARANHLQLAVIVKGTNTYRLLPLSGLNQDQR